MKKTITAAVIMLVVLQSSAQVLIARNTVLLKDKVNRFYDYYPRGYDSTTSQKYPAIIFGHGDGELGINQPLTAVLNNGWPRLLRDKNIPAEDDKFIGMIPQYYKGYSNDAIQAVINQLRKNPKVDPTRIYLAGLSLGGGYGVVQFIGAGAYNADQIAAAVPMCANITGSVAQGRVIAAANLPVWMFHNSGDGAIPVQKTYGTIGNINRAPAPVPAAIYTIFTASGHDCWTAASNPALRVNGKNIYQWMLQFTNQRGIVAPPLPAPPTVTAPPVSASLPTVTTAILSCSAAADGTIATYRWEKVSGSGNSVLVSPGSAQTQVTGLEAGTHVFKITVTDSKGQSASTETTIQVGTPTTPPVLPPAPVTRTLNVSVNDNVTIFRNSAWNPWAIGKTGKLWPVTWSDGTATAGLEFSVSSVEGIRDNGAGYANSMAPDSAIRFAMMNQSTVWRLTASGLDIAKNYDLAIYTARSTGDGETTSWSTGGQTQTISSFRNRDKVARFTDLHPDADGLIIVTAVPGKTYTYFNGLTLIEKPQ